MKFASLISLSIAVMVAVEAAPQSAADGHAIPLFRNPKHKKDFKAAMAKVSTRYPQLNLGIGLKGRRHPRRDTPKKWGVGRVDVVDIGPDYEYYGPVEVGTPPQTLWLNFDTGSADIWFPTADCETDGCKAHRRFNTTQSSSFRKDGRPWSIKYGDGSTASGILGKDYVNAGGIRVHQTIGLALNESVEFAKAHEDGLFGLAFNSKQSVKGVKTFMDTAISTGAILRPIFSVFLPSVRMNGGIGGNYLFGAINPKHHSGQLTPVPVTKQGYWQIHVSDLKYQGKSLGQAASEGIVDTGTSLLFVGDSAAEAVHKNIEGAFNSDEEGGWVVPCALANSTEAIQLTLGGKDFDVPVADFAWDPIKKGSPLCFSGLQGGQDGLWILGDMFIKNNYCVFDLSYNPRILIAPIKY